MKRLLLLVLLFLAAAIAAGAGYILPFTPAHRPVTDLRIEATPERLIRGEYLVHNVVVCFARHTQKEWSKRVLPKVAPERAGGESSRPTRTASSRKA